MGTIHGRTRGCAGRGLGVRARARAPRARAGLLSADTMDGLLVCTLGSLCHEVVFLSQFYSPAQRVDVYCNLWQLAHPHTDTCLTHTGLGYLAPARVRARRSITGASCCGTPQAAAAHLRGEEGAALLRGHTGAPLPGLMQHWMLGRGTGGKRAALGRAAAAAAATHLVVAGELLLHLSHARKEQQQQDKGGERLEKSVGRVLVIRRVVAHLQRHEAEDHHK